MHVGLIISVLLHAAILGWAVITIQTQRELRVAEPEPVAVDLVAPSEVTKLRQGVRTAKQMDAEAKETPKPVEVPRKEAPKPTPVATPKPPEPTPEPPKEVVKEPPKPAELPKEVAKAEPPKPAETATDPIAEKLAAERPDPALEQAKKLEEERIEAARKADEQKKADEIKKAEEQKRLDEQKKEEEARKLAELKKKQDEEKKRKAAELKKKQDDEKKRKEAELKKQKSFDDQMRDMQALLNKVPDKGAPLPNIPQEEPSKNKGPVLGAKEGRDNRLSASELAILAQIIKSCVQSKWNVLGGGESAQGATVKIRLRFNPDGRFASAPEVMNPQNSPFFLAVQDSALRAVEACQPYPLPPAKYEFWRDMVLNFDPRDMF